MAGGYCQPHPPATAGGTDLTLYARRTSLCKCAYLLDSRHRCVARKSCQERAVRPAEFDGLFRRFTREQAVEEPGREAIASAHTVQHCQFCCWSTVGLA